MQIVSVWLKFPRLFLYNLSALIKLERCEQCTIDPMVYLFGNEAVRWYIFLEIRPLGQ